MQITVLGGFAIEGQDGTGATLPTRKAALTLAALAVAGEKGLRREYLAELIWPERGEAQSKSSLRQALTAIRKLSLAAAGLRLEADGENIRLTGPNEAIDCRCFEALAGAKDREQRLRAAALYGGDLLEGYRLDDALDQFFAPARERLRRIALSLAESESTATGIDRAGRETLEGLAHRLLSTDPTAEEAHRTLIRLRLVAGETTGARRQFENCREILRKELGIEPEPATCEILDKPFGKSDAAPPLSPISPTARRGGPALVVLPFDELGVRTPDFFVDGVVEEVTSALSRVRDFFVIARQSAYVYKDRFVDVRDVGRDLGVDYVVEGTVRRGGDRVRISVQLVDTRSGAQLWSERFEDQLTDLFELQDRIASHVAGALSPTIRASEIAAARSRPPDDLGAYELVLSAYPHFWAHRKEENARALALLSTALERDPNYALAYALRAWCHAQSACYMWSEDPRDARTQAQADAAQAAERVAEHASTLVAIGASYSLTTTDHALARSFLERALAIDPNNAWGWMRYGWLHVLFNQPREGLKHLEHAEELSPFDPFLFNILFGKAAGHAEMGEFDRAIELVQAGLRQGPGVTWAYRMLASYYALAGDMEKSAEALRVFLEHYPGMTIAKMKEMMPPSIYASNPNYFDGIRKAGIPEA